MQIKTSINSLKENCVTVGDAYQMIQKLKGINVPQEEFYIVFNETPHLKEMDMQPSPEGRGAGCKPFAEQLIDDLKNETRRN